MNTEATHDQNEALTTGARLRNAREQLGLSQQAQLLFGVVLLLLSFLLLLRLLIGLTVTLRVHVIW